MNARLQRPGARGADLRRTQAALHLCDAAQLLAFVGSPQLSLVHVTRNSRVPSRLLPEAIHFPLEGWLTENPSVPELALRMSYSGIGSGDTIVVYDDHGGDLAYRLAVLLTRHGISCGVLNAGLDGWRAAGGRTVVAPARRAPRAFTARAPA